MYKLLVSLQLMGDEMTESEKVLLNAGYLRGMSTRDDVYREDVEALKEACDHLIEYSRSLRLKSAYLGPSPPPPDPR